MGNSSRSWRNMDSLIRHQGHFKKQEGKQMKVKYNSSIEVSNYTFGKEYDATPSFVKGFVIIIDDNGIEQLIRLGSTLFKWKTK